jgi:hypothetical protein
MLRRAVLTIVRGYKKATTSLASFDYRLPLNVLTFGFSDGRTGCRFANDEITFHSIDCLRVVSRIAPLSQKSSVFEGSVTHFRQSQEIDHGECPHGVKGERVATGQRMGLSGGRRVLSRASRKLCRASRSPTHGVPPGSRGSRGALV